MQPLNISFQIHRAYQLRAYIRVLKLPPLRLHALRLNLNFLIKCLPCSRRWCPDRIQFGALRVDHVTCHTGVGVNPSHVVRLSISDHIKIKQDHNSYHILLKYISQ